MNRSNKWDAIYSHKSQPGESCWLLKNYSHLLPVNHHHKQFKSLDLACGLGANALHLAELGFDSFAWDNSSVALQKAQQFASDNQLAITTQLQDIESKPPLENSFDVIVVSQFLHRPLCRHLAAALKPNGLLFYQTFHQNKLSTSGPNNPDFLLENQELLSLFSNLSLLFYREDGQQGNVKEGLRDMAYLIAQKT